MRTNEPTRIVGQLGHEFGLRLEKLTFPNRVYLGIQFRLERRQFIATKELFCLDRRDKPLAIEEDDVLFAHKSLVDDVDDFVLIIVFEAICPKVNVDIRSRLAVPTDTAAIRIEIVERPCIE